MSLERADNLNITGVWDSVNTANGLSMSYSPANRLKTTYFAPWGQNTYGYDLVGNRTQDIYTDPSNVVTIRTYSLASNANRLNAITAGTINERAYVHDGAGNITSDTRSGTAYVYTYNNRNRLSTVTVGGVLRSTYTYNGLEQVVTRALTNMTPSGTTHFIYDRNGNLIAETKGTGAAGTVREYIYLPETEISPTFGSRTVVDRPLAVVNAVNTASPALWYVHVDHLNRPIQMTDASKAAVWNATWLPWGNVFAITGTAVLDARFPGQWFQLESGLHYNWYRHYDPTIGRFTQPDPLGFVDGPSVYAYAGSSPLESIDFTGLSPEIPDAKISGFPQTPRPDLGKPGTTQPEPLPPPPPDFSRKFFCDRVLAKCIARCSSSMICKTYKPAAVACYSACGATYVLCRALKGGFGE